MSLIYYKSNARITPTIWGWHAQKAEPRKRTLFAPPSFGLTGRVSAAFDDVFLR